jgi:alkylhydroperoxidase/carboxymuconolactone decarboxylase family protein YurZ
VDSNERRERGLAAMVEVYGTAFGMDGDPLAEAPPHARPFFESTVDHLFADVWARPGLSIRDRRLVTIGVTAMLGRADLIELQIAGALENGELDETQIGELVLHLAHYAGWPNAVAVSEGATRALARRAESGPA